MSKWRWGNLGWGAGFFWFRCLWRVWFSRWMEFYCWNLGLFLLTSGGRRGVVGSPSFPDRTRRWHLWHSGISHRNLGLGWFAQTVTEWQLALPQCFPVPRMAEGINYGVPRARGFGQHDRNLSGIWSDQVAVPSHAQHSHCDVGHPGDDEHYHVHGDDFCNLDFLLLLVGSFLIHPWHFLPVLGYGRNNTDIAKQDQGDWNYKLENDEAQIEGDVVPGLGQVVPGAAETETLQHEGPPAEPRGRHPAHGMDPDECDLLESSRFWSSVQHVHGLGNDHVAVDWYGRECIDGDKTTHSSHKSVPLASFGGKNTL